LQEGLKAQERAVLTCRRPPGTESAGWRTRYHSLGAEPCQGGFCPGSGCLRACLTGLSCFPDSCHLRGERPGGSRPGAEPGRAAAQSAGCEPGRQLHRRHARRAWASRNCSAWAVPAYRVGQFVSSNARRAASIARRISAAEASAASPVTSSVAATFGPSSRSRTGRVGHRRAFATLGQPSLLLKLEGTAVAA